ncbi:MAG: CopD family protein [Magnetovibrionaceae bacterium]
MLEFSLIASGLHSLAATIWVGGMVFAWAVLRPATGPLEPPVRLQLWSRVFARFFPLVWVSVIALPATGYAQVYFDFGGFDAAGMAVNVMHGLGLIMIAVFLLLIFGPYRAFKARIAAEDWPGAGAQIAHIRRIVGFNMLLGLIVVFIGASGRFWP